MRLLSEPSGVRYHHVVSAIEAGYRFVDTAQSANMQYNTCKSQFEITFDQNSEIQLDETGPANDIREHYEFVKIDRLESVEPNAYVDILAVVKHVGETTSIVSKKSGKELVKCELTIEDDSGAEVRLTMWGDVAQAAQGKFGGMWWPSSERA
jgi:replication factor A1